MAEVFVSYSWDAEEYNNRIVSFTNHLRKNGFEAQLDRMLSQTETSINFIKMMHSAMQNHKKVIVMLSTGYKQKAEAFTGGVGEEYQLLLNDIKSHPKKYILVSLAGRADEIVPFGLKGRDIIDLSQDGEEHRLFMKLLDQNEFDFSPVAEQKPQISPKKISSFHQTNEFSPIEISNLSFKQLGANLFAGLYKNVDFMMSFDLKNASNTPIDNFTVEVSVSKFLDKEYSLKHTVEDDVVYSQNYTEKIFQGQVKKSINYPLTISNNRLQKILSSEIRIKVFTERGVSEIKYLLKEVVKIRPGANNYSEPVSISEELFSR